MSGRYKVEYSRSLLDAPAEATNLAIEGDLVIRKAHTFVWPFLTGYEDIVWAIDTEVGNKVVACQVWSRKQDGRVWWYEVSYVLPEYRKAGIMVLFSEVVRALAAEDTKVRFRECLVATDNKPMIESLARTNQAPANLHYRFPVTRG